MSLARVFALLAPVRWSAVPDDVGAEFWRRGLEAGDAATVAKGDSRVEYLAKARGGSHRYIKRVATGNPRRPWKYYYNDAAVAQKHAVGDRLNTKAGGKLDVVHVQDGKVHVEDERGQRHELDAHELHARMFGAHVEAAERLATKTAAEWAKARGEAKGTPGESLHAALKAAGMSPEAASSLARFVESRPGWTEAARRTMSDAVAHSGRKPSVVADNLRQVANAAENLRTARNAKAVTPAHVAEAVDLRLPKGKGGDSFPSAWADLRDKLGKANARAEGLITALEHVGPEHKGLADQARAAVADAAHHEARTMAQAFPALRNDPELAHADELAARLGAVLAKAKTPSTTGATTTVYIANKDGAPEPRQARYRVMEADDVHASHLPGESFHLNKNYPEGVQERLYHSDRAEQDKVRANATSFRPDIVHNTNPDAVNGPPLITEDGVVLGGNSRTMSMQLVHGSSKSAALKDHLAANAYQFGLTKEAVEGMKHPILVRELVGVDSKSTPKGELKDLVRRANESFTQGMDPRAMQVALAGRVDDNMLEKLGRMDPEDTLSDFLSKPASRDFVRSMQHAGIIDRRNRSQYLRTDGSLNQDGKQFVERLLVGKMIPDADLLGDVSLQHMAALSRAAPAILAAKTNGATHDLTGDLAVALRTQRDMDVRGHKTIREHLAQDEMDFDTGRLKAKPIEGNDRAMLLHQVLADHGKSPAVVAKMFRQYAKTASKEHDAQAGLFGNAPSSLASLRAAVDMHRPSKGADAGGTVDMFGKGATVYTGPKGGKYSDPEHKHHWTPSKGGAQADWVGAESAEKRAARKAGVDKAMSAWSAAAARMKATPGDRSAFQGHHDALHGLARALNLQTQEGERPADAAAKWLKSQGHKVPTRRSGHRREAEAVQESLFRGRSPLAVAIFHALTTPQAGGLLELPESYGEQLWALAKGATHKYLKRVPKPGGGYRYYYNAGHGGGVHSHEHMVEGAAFRHGDGHFHITKVDGRRLTVRHSQTGEEHETTKFELAAKLHAEHKAAIQAHRQRNERALKDARESGASAKQIAALERRASPVPIVDRKDPHEKEWLSAVYDMAQDLRHGEHKTPKSRKNAIAAVLEWAHKYADGHTNVPPKVGHELGTDTKRTKTAESEIVHVAKPNEQNTRDVFDEAMGMIRKLGDPSKYPTVAEQRDARVAEEAARRAKREAPKPTRAEPKPDQTGHPKPMDDHIAKLAADAHRLAKERGEAVYTSVTPSDPETGRAAQFHIRTDSQDHPLGAQLVNGPAIRGYDDPEEVHARIKQALRGTSLLPLHETPITMRNTAEHTAEIVASRAKENEERASRDAKRAAQRAEAEKSEALRLHDQAKAKQSEAALEHKRLSQEFERTPRNKRTREMAEKPAGPGKHETAALEAIPAQYRSIYTDKSTRDLREMIRQSHDDATVQPEHFHRSADRRAELHVKAKRDALQFGRIADGRDYDQGKPVDFPHADPEHPREGRWLAAVRDLASKHGKASKRDSTGRHAALASVYDWTADHAEGRVPMPPQAGRRAGTEVSGGGNGYRHAAIVDETVKPEHFDEAVKQLRKLGKPSEYATHEETQAAKDAQERAAADKRDRSRRAEIDRLKDEERASRAGTYKGSLTSALRNAIAAWQAA